jgi:transcriptional regulator with XRE-family HTH domain
MNRDDFYTNLGYRLREARGYSSQESVAKALEVSTNTVSRWETGIYKVSAFDLSRLAVLYGKPIAFFFTPRPGPGNLP